MDWDRAGKGARRIGYKEIKGIVDRRRQNPSRPIFALGPSSGLAIAIASSVGSPSESTDIQINCESATQKSSSSLSSGLQMNHESTKQKSTVSLPSDLQQLSQSEHSMPVLPAAESGFPFWDEKRSDDFARKGFKPLEWSSLPTASSKNYCSYKAWLDDIVNSQIDDEDKKTFGKEIIAESWLQWFRKQKKPSCACLSFSANLDSPNDLFALVSFQFYSESNLVQRHAKYTLFAALLHNLNQKGENISNVFYEGTHILHFACHFGYTDLARLLLYWGVDVDTRMTVSGMTALHVVCGHRLIVDAEEDKTMIKYLGANKADLLAKTEGDRRTPLFLAILAQKKEVVDCLLTLPNRKDVLRLLKDKDAHGNSALHLATQINAKEITEAIFVRLIELSAAELKRPKNDLRLLLEFVTAKCESGITPIHYASLHCYEGSCLELIQEYCDIDQSQLSYCYSVEDNDGQSPMDFAAKSKRKSTFEHLWKKLDSFTPIQVCSVGIELNHLIKKAKDTPSNWILVNQYLEKVPRAFIHCILETEVKKENTIDISGEKNSRDDNSGPSPIRGTPMQNVGTVTQSAAPGDSPRPPPAPLSLHDVLHASPGVYHKDHLNTVKTFLDATVFGDEVVLSKAFDSDPEGRFDDAASAKSSLTLHTLLTSDLPIWGHKAVKAWIDRGIRHGGWNVLFFSFVFYLAFLGSLSGALYLGASAQLTSTGLALQYTGRVPLEPRDAGRIVLEVLVLIYTLNMLGMIVYEIVLLKLHYFRLFTVFLRIGVVFFVVILIICRASTIDGQWIVASLLFLSAAFVCLDYLIIWTCSNVYVWALWVIIRKDVVKFLLVAFILMFAFSGALYLSFRASRPPSNMTSPSVVCMNVNSSDSDSNSTTCVPTGSISILLAGEFLPLGDLLFENVKTVAHGAVTIPYNDFSLYSILLYLTFVVIILLLMINSLIAQITDSFVEARDHASQLANYAKARFLQLTYPGRINCCAGKLAYTFTSPCCCYKCQHVIKRDKFIWINGYISEDDPNSGGWRHYLKYSFHRVLKTAKAIFGKGNVIVADNSAGCTEDAKLAEVKQYVDRMVEVVVEHLGEQSTPPSPKAPPMQAAPFPNSYTPPELRPLRSVSSYTSSKAGDTPSPCDVGPNNVPAQGGRTELKDTRKRVLPQTPTLPVSSPPNKAFLHLEGETTV